MQANIYAKDFEFENLSKKAKQSIRTATNKGVEIIVGGAELLDDFSSLMAKTEERKGIILRGQSYYHKLLTTYADHSYITMAFLDLSKQKNLLSQQLDKASAEQAKFNEKVSLAKSLRIKRLLSDLRKS